jgi:hypothetical protein
VHTVEAEEQSESRWDKSSEHSLYSPPQPATVEPFEKADTADPVEARAGELEDSSKLGHNWVARK